MAKTKHFYFGISSYNTPFITTRISQAEYNRLLQQYSEIVYKNNKELEDDMNEYYLGLYEESKYIEDRHVTEYRTEIQDGATYIALLKLECDEGYRFK